MRNFVDTQDFTKEELLEIKDLGIKVKKYLKDGDEIIALVKKSRIKKLPKILEVKDFSSIQNSVSNKEIIKKVGNK